MMMQRKNKPKAAPILKSSENNLESDKSPQEVVGSRSHLSSRGTAEQEVAERKGQPSAGAVTVAKVKRRRCGTSPFDDTWLNLDCCGLACAALTYCLHAYGVYAFCLVLIPPWMSVTSEDGYRQLTKWGLLHDFLFVLVAVLAVVAHFRAMTTDPGAVPPDANPLPDPEELEELIKGEQGESGPFNESAPSNNHKSSLMEEDATLENGGMAVGIAAAAAVGMAAVGAAALPSKAKTSPVPRGRRMCRRCQAFKPPRAHHCSICKRCIIKMDHHCPWVNNCVGIGNHKYFLLFIFYTSLSCSYTLLFVTYRFFHCIGRYPGRYGPRCVDHPTDLLPLIGLTVEALLFGLFTLCMMVDQWDVVTTNLTHIDRLKGLGGDNFNTARRAGINEVFGTTTKGSRPTGFHMTWLSPIHKVCFPESVRDDIFGYCRPCSLKSNFTFGKLTSKQRGEIANSDGRVINAADIV